jgi:hypothetical protein
MYRSHYDALRIIKGYISICVLTYQLFPNWLLPELKIFNVIVKLRYLPGVVLHVEIFKIKILIIWIIYR